MERILGPLLIGEPGLQPAFQPLFACEAKREARGFGEAGRRTVEHWLSWALPDGEGGPEGHRTAAAEARRIEARAVARDLRELADAGLLAWREAAVLLRTTTAQEVYLRALREAGVPYVVERDRTYYQRREVIDATALLRAVLDPHDQLALVACLRSPVVGVPDAAWLPLWRHGFPERAAALGAGGEPALERALECVRRAARELDGAPGLGRIEGWERSLEHALTALAELREAHGREPADRFIELLRARFLAEETEAARFLGAHRLANLERFFRRLLAALTGGGGTQAILRELRAGVAGEREEEVGAPGDESLDAVRVLTIHKAKGLEFAHVYLVDLHHELSSRRGPRSRRPSRAPRRASSSCRCSAR